MKQRVMGVCVLVCDVSNVCKKGSRILEDYVKGNELFTSRAVGIAKLHLARGVREGPDTTVVEPHVLGGCDMLFNPLLITAISDGIKFEVS